jgi:hypothetical protein
MSYKDLAALAKKMLGAAAAEPPGSVERAMKWAAHDAIVNEFKRRVLDQVRQTLGLPPADIPDEALSSWRLSAWDMPDIEL